MTNDTHLDEPSRRQIIANPELVLADTEIMQALVDASGMGGSAKVVDIRNIAMQRLEDRFAQLDSRHRTVIAAAYDNLLGITQVQNALLCLLEARSPADFQQALERDITKILRVDSVQIVQEGGAGPSPADIDDADDAPAERQDQAASPPDAPCPATVPMFVPTGFIEHYMKSGPKIPPRDILLRATRDDTLSGGRTAIFGPKAAGIASEACVRLNLGRAARPALLVLGATDANQFNPQQGTDLLSFFGEAVARILRRLVT